MSPGSLATFVSLVANLKLNALIVGDFNKCQHFQDIRNQRAGFNTVRSCLQKRRNVLKLIRSGNSSHARYKGLDIFVLSRKLS